MTQHNNWKDEFRDYFDKALKPKKETMKNLDREMCVNFIDTLLIERTKACLEIIKNKASGDRANIGVSAPQDYVNGYKYACEDIATQITKLIETEE